jgi:hypothetical protein
MGLFDGLPSQEAAVIRLETLSAAKLYITNQ